MNPFSLRGQVAVEPAPNGLTVGGGMTAAILS